MAGLIPSLALALSSVPFAASGSAAADRTGETDIVTTATDALQRMTVPVRIGGGGTYRFLVDTGAQNTVISNELAARLALPETGTALVMGVAGQVRVGVVTLDDLGLGRRNFGGLTAPMLKQNDIGADGIVGLDSLQKQRVVLDFRRGLIAIGDVEEERESGYDIVVHARRRSGQLIITQARIDGVKVDVVIDTGSDSSIGNLALAAALAHRGPVTTGRLSSVTGQEIATEIAMSRELLIGPLKLQNVSIAYTDAPPFAALGLAGRPAILLGMSELRAFKRVAIDFSERKILFDFDLAEPDKPTGDRH